MSRTRRAGSLVTAGAVAVAALASLAGPAEAKPVDPQSFWTPERMRQAKPAKVPVAKGLPRGARRLHRVPGGSGRPHGGKRAPALPKTIQSIRSPRARASRRLATASWIDLALPWKIISHGYTSATNAVGRLYFRTSTGGQSFCTASVVAANVIVTAAHCVADGGSGAQSHSFKFVPKVYGSTALHNGFFAKTSGGSDWYGVSHWNGWNADPFRCSSGGPAGTCQGYFAMDYAFITLRPDSAGRNVGHYTGWYGLWPNPPAGTVYHLGYPGEGSWSANQNYPYHCKANVQRFTKYAYDNRYDMGMSCYTTGGSSGGPWLMTSNGVGYVAAVQSHMAPVQWQNPSCGAPCGRYGTTWYGPRFDNDTVRLLNLAKAK